MSHQPTLPDIYVNFPETPERNQLFRIYKDDGWFDQGRVQDTSNGYVHVKFDDWTQSWLLDDLRFTVIDFAVVLMPKEVTKKIETAPNARLYSFVEVCE